MIHVGSVWIHAMLDLNLLQTPDLVFARPLAPDSHGGAWVGIAMVGEIDVELGVTDENTKVKDPSPCGHPHNHCEPTGKHYCLVHQGECPKCEDY